MSRIGKKPVVIPGNVQANVSGQTVKVKGPKGELSVTLPEEVTLEQSGDTIIVAPRDETKRARSMWGLSRTLVDNIVEGTTNGYSKTLEIQGVGYRAQMKGKDLQLNLGFSHEVVHAIPKGIDVEVTKPTEIVVSGIDKQLVGQVAAEIRSYRPPEPYQGKGVRYQGEYIFRKEGKKK